MEGESRREEGERGGGHQQWLPKTRVRVRVRGVRVRVRVRVRVNF